MSEVDSNYGNDSIEYKGEIEGVRTRPESLLGSKDLDGAKHTVIEMIGNSLDEKNSGYGDKLVVTWFGDGRVAVRDYGRGIPLGYNESQGRYNWELIYMKLYAGGKYTDFSPLKKLTPKDWDAINYNNYGEYLANLGINYLFSVGLNGLGSAATSATSRTFLVKSFRGGEESSMLFKEGQPAYKELKVQPTDEATGTYVEWQPDPTVFTDAFIPKAWLKDLCRKFSYSAGITVDFIDEDGNATTYQASNVNNMLAEQVENGFSEDGFINPLAVEIEKGLYHNAEVTKRTAEGREYEMGVMVYDLAIGGNPKGNIKSQLFVNNVSVRGGTPEEGFRDAVSGFFNEQARERGIRLRPSDFEGRVVITASILANLTNYRNQTKDAVSDQYIYEGINYAVQKMLRHAYMVGAPWLKDALKATFDSYEARTLAEQMRIQSREVKKAVSRQVNSRKFQPCRTYGKKGKEEATELWIVEGDSAGDHLLNSRDSNYQALYYLRGKGRNPLKSNAAEVLSSNKEIGDILSIIGMGNKLTGDEDVSKSKIGKVIIASDADRDGYHIRMLTFLIMWVYVPDLLYKGMVYVAEPPLWRVDLQNGEKRFYITDAEYEQDRDYINSVGIKGKPHRYKGLGQMEEEDLSEVVMNPQNRVLHQVKIDRTDDSIDKYLAMLFGSSTTDRREGILKGALGEEGLAERYDEMRKRADALRGYRVDDDIEEELIAL